MRAVCREDPRKVRVESVPGPEIRNGRDPFIKVTSTALRGSDLRLYDGVITTMKGDILGP